VVGGEPPLLRGGCTLPAGGRVWRDVFVRVGDAGATGLLVRSTVRRHVVALLLLVVSGALAFGFVLTVAAGARRTSTSFDRFRARTSSPHVMVGGVGDALRTAERLSNGPGVASAGGFMYFPVVPRKPGVEPMVNAGGFAALHESFGTDVYRYRVLDGRRADPRAEDEITVNEELAELAGVEVGDRVGLASIQDIVQTEATVVGIHLGEFDIGANAANPAALFTAAFARRWLPVLEERLGGMPPPAYLVRLRDPSPAGQAEFRSWARGQFGPEAMVLGTEDLGSQTDDALAVQTLALVALAAVSGLAAVIALGQAVDRVVTTAAGDGRTVAALGMTRRDRARALAVPPAAAVGTAAVLGLLVAILASTVMPLGFARRIEPDPGVDIDLLVLPAVSAAGVLLLLVQVGRSAWRRAVVVDADPLPRAPSLPSLASMPATVGVRRALGSGTPVARVQSRSTIAALVLAVTGVVAVVTFVRGQDQLLSTPREHGWNFDVIAMANGDEPGSFDTLLGDAARSRAVAAYGSVGLTRVVVGDADVDAVVVTSLRGDVHPTMVDGRVATAGDEVVLGTRIARALDVGVGDEVVVTASNGEATMTVTGIAVIPIVGEGEFGHSISLSEAGARELALEFDMQGVLADLAAGASAGDLPFREPALGEVVEPYLPPSLVNLQRAGDVPVLLAAFLALLGLAAVLHALIVTVRQSRRDVAVLQTIGFVRRQVVSAFAWQATTYAVIAAVVGVPLGFVIGRTAWFATAGSLGVERVVALPVLGAALVIGVALVATNAAASLPAWRAARLRPAQVFRSE